MSSMIAIMGQSGSGKTTSLRNLNPETTFIIDADRKGLSWAGWKRSYVEGKNYKRESEPAKVRAILETISKTMPKVKTVVVDTVNSIMIDDEIRRMKETGYGKWTDLAQSVYEMISDANVLRDDLVIVWTFHCEVCEDEVGGNKLVRFQTNGRKLQKINLEAKFPTVLYAKAKGDGVYVFETQANQSVTKSPMGMFDKPEIQNDLNAVIERVRAFESEGGPLQEVPMDILPVSDTSKAQAGNAREEAWKRQQELFGKLIELQGRDNVPNFKLLQFLRDPDRNILDAKQKLEDLTEEVLVEMVKPENWAKIVAAIGAGAKPAEQKQESPATAPTGNADVFSKVSQIRARIAQDKVSEDGLTKFLVSQGMLSKGKDWWECEEDIFDSMLAEGVWPKIVNAVNVTPF